MPGPGLGATRLGPGGPGRVGAVGPTRSTTDVGFGSVTAVLPNSSVLVTVSVQVPFVSPA